MEELPSLDAVMSEIDSDIGSINSSLLLPDGKISCTPTPSFEDRQQTGSILRHVIYQGITAQIGSAAVRPAPALFVMSLTFTFLGPNGSWFRLSRGSLEDGCSWNVARLHSCLRQHTNAPVVQLRGTEETARCRQCFVVQLR